MSRKILHTFLVVFFIIISTPLISAANHIDRMIVFGDSLSDNGNDYLLTQHLHKYNSKIPIFPAPELYWNGRFSDGPVWSDYLANILHFIPDPLAPEQRMSNQLQNFAYGGAWAETSQPKAKQQVSPPSLSLQIDAYLLKTIKENPETFQQIINHDLIFIWIGGNDYLNEQLMGTPTTPSAAESTDAVVATIQANLIKLIQHGASHLVLFGLPDLSKVPNIYLRDPEEKLLVPNLALISSLHNKKLQQLLTDISAIYPAAHLNYIDSYQLFADEYSASAQRAQHYRLGHQNHFQKTIVPCLLEPSDPDPTTIALLNNPILAMSVIPTHFTSLRMTQNPYRQCDLHKALDQQSRYDYAEDYTAGGMFFDHVHPLTQIHAKIALSTCQQLFAAHYQFLEHTSGEYRRIVCDSLSITDLIQKIVNPPFPHK